MKVKLVAPTAEGFGGPDFYEEIVVNCETKDDIRWACVNFALKYHVSIDTINVEYFN